MQDAFFPCDNTKCTTNVEMIGEDEVVSPTFIPDQDC